MSENASFIIDGHVHNTNRVYWEGIDPWEKQSFGFDYASAHEAGVRAVIENVAPYGYANFNYTPKQSLRLVETFLRVIERHPDRMALALTAEDARRIAGEDRMAVFLAIELGFDRGRCRCAARAVPARTTRCAVCNADLLQLPSLTARRGGPRCGTASTIAVAT